MNKLVVTLSKKFFKEHFRSGEPTEFKEKVEAGTKIHTCRKNLIFWQYKIAELKKGKGVFSLRQWSANPYRSPQEVIKDVPAEIVGVQKLELTHHSPCSFTATVDGKPVTVGALAKNDGLTLEEYISWFMPLFRNAPGYEEDKPITLTFAIIHFTEFRY